LIPATQREGGLLLAHQQFAEALDLFTEILYSHETLDHRTGNLINLPLGSLGIYKLPANNPYNPFGETVGISYSYPGIETKYDHSQTFVRPLIGIRGALFTDWNYEITGFLSEDRTNPALNFLPGNFTQAALNSSNPATALNPFAAGAPGSPQLLQSLQASERFRRYRYFDRLIGGQGVLRGSPLELPAGPLQAVFGGEYGREAQYTLQPFGSPATDFRRVSYALFTEERVPLLQNRGHTRGGDRLAITVAGRFDHSDDFGSKTTGQGAVEWRPSETLLLRGGYSMSYKAPQLQEISGGIQGTFDQGGLIDPARGNEVVAVPVAFGSNSNLKPRPARPTPGVLFIRARSWPALRCRSPILASTSPTTSGSLMCRP